MRAGVAFILGILVTIGAFFIFAAVTGVSCYGIAVQIEYALAIALFAIAVIVTLIFLSSKPNLEVT